MTQTKGNQVQDRADVKLFTLKLSHDLNLQLEFLEVPQSQTDEFFTVEPEELVSLFMNSNYVNACCNQAGCTCNGSCLL